MKLALVGGGGFRAPGMYEALLDADDLPVDELVLHDVDAERLALVAAVLRGIEAERRHAVPFRTTEELDDALDGAGAIFCAIRVGGLEARLVDESVPLELDLLGQETVGAGGILCALRGVPVMRTIAERAAERAPRAWFFNYTNPAGLVTEAIHDVLGDRAIGICDAPSALFRGIAHALGRQVRELEFDYGGINHLGWLRAVRDGGSDLLPDLLADDDRLATFQEGRIFPAPLLRTLGRLPNEYLVYYYAEREIVASIKATEPRARVLLRQQEAFYGGRYSEPADALAAWRAALRSRSASYMAEVHDVVDVPRGEEADVPPDGGLGGYTGVALATLRALASGRPATIVLNTANRGAVPFLDDRSVVEVPCRVDGGGVRPLPTGGWTLHEQGLVSLVKDVERAAIEAAVASSREKAVRALALHPLVSSVEAAKRILARADECLPERDPRMATTP